MLPKNFLPTEKAFAVLPKKFGILTNIVSILPKKFGMPENVFSNCRESSASSKIRFFPDEKVQEASKQLVCHAQKVWQAVK